MIHMTFSEPEVMLLVILLRAVPFPSVLLRKYGIFWEIRLDRDSLELRANGVTGGNSRKGIIE